MARFYSIQADKTNKPMGLQNHLVKGDDLTATAYQNKVASNVNAVDPCARNGKLVGCIDFR